MSREQLWTLTEARVVIEDWRWKYNNIRPHRSLGYITPLEFAQGEIEGTSFTQCWDSGQPTACLRPSIDLLYNIEQLINPSRLTHALAQFAYLDHQPEQPFKALRDIGGLFFNRGSTSDQVILYPPVGTCGVAALRCVKRSQPEQPFKSLRDIGGLFLVHRRLAGKALIYVGSVGFCFLLMGGTTSVSSANDAEVSGRIISSWRLLDVHVVSKVPVVDTEVDPPQQNSCPIRLRIVSPR